MGPFPESKDQKFLEWKDIVKNVLAESSRQFARITGGGGEGAHLMAEGVHHKLTIRIDKHRPGSFQKRVRFMCCATPRNFATQFLGWSPVYCHLPVKQKPYKSSLWNDSSWSLDRRKTTSWQTPSFHVSSLCTHTQRWEKEIGFEIQEVYSPMVWNAKVINCMIWGRCSTAEMSFSTSRSMASRSPLRLRRSHSQLCTLKAQMNCWPIFTCSATVRTWEEADRLLWFPVWPTSMVTCLIKEPSLLTMPWPIKNGLMRWKQKLTPSMITVPGTCTATRRLKACKEQVDLQSKDKRWWLYRQI